ncbi:MAG: hypothetical protein JXQ73_26280 [Phycisphaerae bacterium]|nr:hypothetical protein [Phycisphaerae bacterium]
MLDALSIPRWVQRILADSRTSDFLDLAAVILPDKPEPSATTETLSTALYRGYEALDRALFHAEPDATEMIDWSGLLGETRIIRVMLARQPNGDLVSEDDLDHVRATRLDVILDLGRMPPTRGLSRAARFGVWKLRYCGAEQRSAAAPFFHEIFCKTPAAAGVLEILAERPEDHATLWRSVGAADLSSLHRSRNAAYWKSAELIVRCLRLLHDRGWDYLVSREPQPEEPGAETSRREIPGNLAMIRFLLRQGKRYLRNRSIKHLFNPKWFLAVRPAGQMNHQAYDTTGFEVIEPPKGQSWADPFLLEQDDRTHVFFEDLVLPKGKGVISHLTIAPDGARSPSSVVLQREYHLSYPFVFEWKKQVFMIPETAQNRTVELYRAVEFPARWELQTVLFRDLTAVDTTLLERDGRFWLFTNIGSPGGGNNDDLFLFHGESPLGPWTPHPLNPVVSDVRRARPAGRLFYSGDQLLRPSQDCSNRYGGAIAINRVVGLTETEYHEEPFARIEPTWYPGALGTHTLNRTERFEIIDGYVLRWKWRR